MVRLNPSGKYLMNFCFVNLLSYDNQIQILSVGGYLDKIQFSLVKRRAKKLVTKVEDVIFRRKIYEFDTIIESLSFHKSDVWDKLFIYLIVQYIIILASKNAKSNTENKVIDTLALYLSYIKREQNTSIEILNLKLEKIRLQCEMDLLFVSAHLNRNKG